MKNDKKVFFALFISVLVAGCLISAGSVLAGATIISAKLNGSSNVAVEGSAQITATVSVSLTNKSVWKSTAYRFGTGEWICVNTPDHDKSATEKFSINAPAKQGTSNASFVVYGNDACVENLSAASILTSVTRIMSFGNGWLYIILLVLLAGTGLGIGYWNLKKAK